MPPTTSRNPSPSTPHYIPEWDDAFLALFSHRYDYIWAEHPAPGQKVSWKTESRHPLSDRLIQQGAYLYGVRFGAQTTYCVIDIDAGSLYHPKRDRFAIARIMAALEPLGLVSALICTSSYSGGLHLYLPFQAPQKTWELALALETRLGSAGFKPALGQLEVFPNVRQYVTEGQPNLYTAHRLPLQAGSYLLTSDLQQTLSTQESFIQQWHFAQRRNSINAKSLKQVLKLARKRHYGLTGKADKFLNDLNAEIELGWSRHGQTNRLLGRIAMRAYIFGHVLKGGQPLAGKALADEIVCTALALPGYADWCRHQHEIEQRAEEWARSVQSSARYFPFGAGKTTTTERSKPDGRVICNQQRRQSTRDRICQAIADLLNQAALPSQATARFKILTTYRIGGGSLYEHKDLWHPTFLNEDTFTEPLTEPVETPLEPPNADQVGTVAENSPSYPTSLLDGNASNQALGQGLTEPEQREPLTDASNVEVKAEGQQVNPAVDSIMVIKAQLAANREAKRQAVKQQPMIAGQRGQAKVIARMQGYLQSGDPILMAEAIAWAEVNPGVLAGGIELDRG